MNSKDELIDTLIKVVELESSGANQQQKDAVRQKAKEQLDELIDQRIKRFFADDGK